MKDFSNLNHLSTDVKVLVVNGQGLVDKAKEAVKSKEYRFDLTGKTQLRTDCREVEKYIKLISKGEISDKSKKAFELAIVRLQTTLDGLIKFYTR